MEALLTDRPVETWKFSILHPPGRYLDRSTGRSIYWSGTPRQIENWEQAEKNAAALMNALGYDAEVTPPGADEGIDVRSTKALAQVKYEKTKTSRPALQQLYGARAFEHQGNRKHTPKELWCFSLTGYTKTALEYANRNSILLFTYALNGEPTPVNKIARDTFTRLLEERARRLDKRRAFTQSLYVRARVASSGQAPELIIYGDEVAI
jgi:hypothetical protein